MMPGLERKNAPVAGAKFSASSKNVGELPCCPGLRASASGKKTAPSADKILRVALLRKPSQAERSSSRVRGTISGLNNEVRSLREDGDSTGRRPGEQSPNAAGSCTSGLAGSGTFHGIGDDGLAAAARSTDTPGSHGASPASAPSVGVGDGVTRTGIVSSEKLNSLHCPFS